jgi:ATP phosphoribosyltransferase regulatory subunit
MDYYDGVVFSGYVLGIPESLLRGGEYGRLIAKMGREGSAVGFAVYTDLIDLIDKGERGIDADILLVCDEDQEPCAIADAVARLRLLGNSVLVQRSLAGRERCRKAMRLAGRRFEEIE